MKIKNPFAIFNKFDLMLWLLSVSIILLSYVLGGGSSILILIASLIGVTSLIFTAKGNVLGQMLTVIFSLIYGVISFQFQYYGEMITYLGMTLPIAVMSVVSWMKHPYENDKAEVEVAKLGKKQKVCMIILTVGVTTLFYFVLKYFNTANIVFSTISIATSFLASYLMLFRSPAYAVAYAANDIVLIILWILATFENNKYFSMVVCFFVFFANDIYGFCSWKKMRDRQSCNSKETCYEMMTSKK